MLMRLAQAPQQTAQPMCYFLPPLSAVYPLENVISTRHAPEALHLVLQMPSFLQPQYVTNQ